MRANALRCAGLIFVSAVALRAEVIIETVPVGNPGNPGEWSGQSVQIQGTIMGAGNDRICGFVPYPFEIGKFEITVAQYIEFLNAVAANDPYGLFNTGMDANGVVRLGEPGSYTYQVGDGSPNAMTHWGNRPIGSIAWCDAARFANWMENGQPSGLLTGVGTQDAWLTEDGTYATLGAPPSGANSNLPYQSIVRRPGATWVIPSEDEWYKAAYHRNDGVTANYFRYPTQFNGGGFFNSDIPDNNVIDPDPGNSANFHIGNPDDDCINVPFSRTNVGEFENSGSAYGTFDQGGNVWEWTDTRYLRADGTLSLRRVIRGASYYPSVVEQQPDGFKCMHAAWRQDEAPVAGVGRYGFRLAKVSNDCNGNGIHDYDDLTAGTESDHNYNGVLDECDIAGGASQDCNENGIPDEAEVGAVSPPHYFVDDGVPAGLLSAIPYPGGELEGYMLWLNQFTIVAGRETIGGITPSFINGYVPMGTQFTVCVWSDEVGQGNPADASLLISTTTTMTAGLETVDIPATYVGPAGTSFFVGILMHITDVDATYPASYDDSSDHRVSWLAWDAFPIDPNHIGLAPNLVNLHDWLGGGNWMVRAEPAVTVEPLPDVNQNGIPDECESGGCPGNVNGDQVVDLSDLTLLLAAFGSSSGDPGYNANADLDASGSVELSDLALLLANFGTTCP